MTDLPSSTFFALSRDGGVVHLEMNNADKANAMTPAFWAELPQICRALNSDPSVRCVVLSGRGRHFTAGMDLSAFSGIADLTQAEAGRAAYALRDQVLYLQDSLTALEKLRVPVIAATHGACVGAGIDMITACDLRVSSADVRFSIEEIHIGMAADVGTLQRLPKLIPPGIVSELAYTGRRFSAAEAQGWGLVNAVFDGREATIAGAMAMAQNIAAKSPLAIAGIKRSIAYARDHSVEDALEQIATWNAGMLRPEDMMSAIQAKMAKQEAAFADLLKDAV
ncbi:MAG: crotonase/enoyl-CoA hydratase family protein [Pseudomonadota bacterium]